MDGFMKSNKIIIFLIAIFIISSFFTAYIYSQENELTNDDKLQVIDKLISELNNAYIFPDIALKMETFLRENLDNQKYNNISNPTGFASVLTRDLRLISRDKHLHVDYFSEQIPKEKSEPEELTPVELERIRNMEESENFGFHKVKILKGNIGYIKLTSFMNPAHATKTIANAFNTISNTEALIIDLRENEGGNPYMVQLICSYLFDSRILLNSIYWRNRNTTDEFYTLSYLEGKRYLEKKVYVLTSSKTFSAAEEFAYNLQALKRAIIVGETTAGGAHPGIFVKLTDNFGMFLPTGVSINPITKTNWEGTGVIPDVLCLEKDALKSAKKHIQNFKK